MRFISLWAPVGLLFTVAAKVGSVPVAPAENVSASSVGVLQPQDIGIQRLYRGRPIPHGWTIYTLYWAQLEIYRRTVQHRGDGLQAPLDIELEHHSNLRLEIRPYAYGEGINSMTLGSSWYGISSMMQTMLVPQGPADGFWELKWRIFRKAIRPRVDVPLGYLNLLLGGDATLRNITSHNLGAPYRVPESDLTLLIGSRGAGLVQGNVVYIMDTLMSTAWQNVARNQNVQRVLGQTWTIQSQSRVSVTLRPRMNGGTSMFTDTDLAEAAFGMATYFILQQPAPFATKITVVRPGVSGRRVPIGEFEIRSIPHRVEAIGSGNDTAAETS
ncbi:MAG: hypothetical protein LQ349_002788 [Xanthoria aureola]|nr:MAG: hypothetical protein LQ349_002788 [Xanthoria aureola]